MNGPESTGARPPEPPASPFPESPPSPGSPAVLFEVESEAVVAVGDEVVLEVVVVVAVEEDGTAAESRLPSVRVGSSACGSAVPPGCAIPGHGSLSAWAAAIESSSFSRPLLLLRKLLVVVSCRLLLRSRGLGCAGAAAERATSGELGLSLSVASPLPVASSLPRCSLSFSLPVPLPLAPAK